MDTAPRKRYKSHPRERLERLEFGYIAYPGTKPDCNAADALALGRFCSTYKDVEQALYFEKAYLSACRGLELPNAPEVLERLKYSRFHEQLEGRPSPFKVGSAMVFNTLKEVKESCFAFRLKPPPQLEGDPYDSYRGSSLAKQDPETFEAVRNVRVWKVGADDTTLRALYGIDLAMCRLIGWSLDPEISFRRLYDEFDYPDPPPQEPHPDDYY